MGSYRKVYLAIYCEDEAEYAQAQRVAEDISKTFRLAAKDLIRAQPIIVNNGKLIGDAVRTISKEGMSGVAKVLPKLIKMRRS